MRKTISVLVTLILFFGPALLVAVAARALGASAGLAAWAAVAVFLGANCLLFAGGVYGRLER